jgi:putative flippase GtrA
LIISNLFLYIFSGLIPYLHLKIISMPFIVSFQFLLNYFWTFKKQ